MAKHKDKKPVEAKDSKVPAVVEAAPAAADQSKLDYQSHPKFDKFKNSKGEK